MRLFLVRHAVTAETGKMLSGRLPGISLSDAGIAMAEEAASSLASLKPAALVTSPIERCRETALILGRQWGLRPSVNRAFIEADYGRWSGRSLKSLYRLKAWSQLMAAASRFRFPDGETLGEVQRRAVAAVEDLSRVHPRSSVVAVSHADVIRAVVAHYLGMPLDLIHRLSVGPASVSVVDLPREGPPLVPVVNQRTSSAR